MSLGPRLLRAIREIVGWRGVDELAREEELLFATLEWLTEGVLAVNSRRQIVRLNETGRRLLGVDDDVPFPAHRLPHNPVLRSALANALAGGTMEGVESTLGDRVVTITARPLVGGGAVLALYDLTATRRLEAMRRDFVANVSHELKTPLTVIGGFAETLCDDELPVEMRRQFLGTILANTERMRRIVDDLLDLSRIESGGWLPNPETLDTAHAIAEAAAAVEATATRKGIALRQEVARDATTLHADPTAVRQLLSNLVDNGVRHTSAGSVTIFARRAGEGTWLGVRDTGHGIPPEHLPRIFERFYRVDPGRSRQEGGTGLGLSIVKHLAEAHGGRVQAESRVGEGTSIAVWLPDRDDGGAAER